MPFTPAHTAAVLPFIRSRYVSATGLVMGSIAPDFEYFIKFSVAGVHGHTWPGLLYFDLPVAFLISVLFHAVVKRNLVLSLPGFIQSRFVDILDAGFIAGMKRNPLRFIFSALAGSATHIIWDGFTHNGGFFVDYFTFFDGAFVPYDGVNYPLWYALQHISTFVGLTTVVVFLMLKESGPAQTQGRISYWIIVTAITFITVAIRFWLKSSDYNLGNLVVCTISGLCIGLILCGLIPFWKETGTNQHT